MKVLITGATGFVGRWLSQELASAGHEPVAAPPSSELDVTNMRAVRDLIAITRPDAISHLAAVSFGPDARRDPTRAFQVNVGGTQAVLEAVASLGRAVPVLVTGSSEAYGAPRPEDLPLRETASLHPTEPYGLSKLAAEAVALACGVRLGLPVVVTRAFNHTGPGQRSDFVAPAVARRVLAAQRTSDRVIRMGNVDVRRDIGDVRDVVRAYRLILERLAEDPDGGGRVFNVSTGTPTEIRSLVEIMARAAGFDAEIVIDPDLVRADEPREIVGSFDALRDYVGWAPSIPLDRTLSELLESVRSVG